MDRLGLDRVGAQASDGTRRGRGAVVVNGFTLTFRYEKAATKLAEALVKGKVIPRLEVEFARSSDGIGATYLRYEMRNVQLTNDALVREANRGAPILAFVNAFEEIKATYTEYDEGGKSLGSVGYEYTVGQ